MLSTGSVSGGVVGNGVRMAPPGEPEPEVSFLFYLCTCRGWGVFIQQSIFVHRESGVLQ